MIPDDKLAEKIRRRNIPISASMELTWRCNMKCLFCYQCQSSSNELNTREIKNILDQLKNEGCLYLALTGGEPLMRSDFWEISEYARYLSFAVTMQTNGTLITNDVADRVKDMGFFSVHISLHGATARTHDLLSGCNGSFDKVISAVEYLKKCDVNIVLKTTLVKQNFSEFADMMDLAEDLGVDHVVSPVVYPRNNGDLSPLEFRLDDACLRHCYSVIFARDREAMKTYQNRELSPLCLFGCTVCGINAEGKVYPCIAVPKSVGDLRKNSFHGIWTMSRELGKIRSVELRDLPECAKCEFASICTRCSGLALLEDGKLLGVSEECCRITKIIGGIMTDEKEKI